MESIMEIRNTTQSKTIERVDEGLRQYMIKVYNYMAMGLLVTALAAYVTVSTSLVNMFFTIQGTKVSLSFFGWVITFAPLAMVLFFNRALNKSPISTVRAFFWGFSTLMGMSLAPILLIYTGASISRIFLITAAMFGGMSLYGYTTKKDLTSIGSFLYMGLLGVIIASIANLFFKSPGMSYVVSLITVVVFVGLTAYDTQKIREMYSEDEDTRERSVVYGALSIYLDFINLFLALLRLFGDRR